MAGWFDWLPIGGIVIALGIFYLLFQRLWYGGVSKVTLQNAMVQLKDSQPATINGLSDGAASSVTTLWWMYVNNWTTGGTRTVLSFGSAATVDWKMTMHATKPQLVLTVGNTDYTCTANFPMQKWTMVSVVFDGGIIDVYIDAQLVQSFRQSTVTSFQTTQLVFGQGLDVAIANVRRFPNRVYSPTEISAEYYKNNNRMQAVKYGLQLNVTRDDQITSEWKLI